MNATLDEQMIHNVHEEIRNNPMITRNQLSQNLRINLDDVRICVVELEDRELIVRDEPWR